MSKPLSDIQRQLRAKGVETHKDFATTMVPGAVKIYGVKMPDLNLMARQYQEGSFELARELWSAGALEEKIIAIKIMERIGKRDPLRLLKLFREFARDIGNWAVCDGLGMQFLRGIRKTHGDELFKLAAHYNQSKDPWQRRLSLVMVEWYTRDPGYRAAIRKLVKHLQHDEAYYVKKAITWINKNVEKGK